MPKNTDATTPNIGRMRRWLIGVGSGVLVLAIAGAAVWEWHEQPSFCSTVCHSTMAPYYATYSGVGYLVAAHAQEGITCLECHEPTIESQMAELQIQLSGDVPSPLKQREMPNDFCGGEDCHGAATLKEMSEVTGHLDFDPHTNHVTLGGRCTGCHNMHAPQVITCTQCHTEEELDYKRFPTELAEGEI